jgi:tRNA G26 N,N-dimethylase Trm1
MQFFYVIWTALACSMASSAVARAQEVPSDLDAALHKNQDHIEFTTYVVSKTDRNDQEAWVCGKMVAVVGPPGTGQTQEFKFVATFFPEMKEKLLADSPRSWITLTGPPLSDDLSQERYKKYCD